MKRLTSFVVAALVIGGFLSTAHAQLYWDINGAAAGGSNSNTATGTWGAGGVLPGDFNSDGFVDAADYVVWRKTNSGDAAAYATWRANFGASGGGGGGSWTSDPSGTSTTTTWTDGQTAIFSAGTGVTGAYTVTLDNTKSAAGITFEEGNITISGGTSLDLTGSATIDVDPLATGAAGTISSVIGGTAGLNKSSNGTLALGGANTYTGVTNVNAGLLSVTNIAALGGSTDGTVVANGSTLQIATTGTVTIANEAININGTGSTGTNGALFKNSTGTTTLSGLVTLDSDARINGGGGGTLTLSGGVAGGSNLTVGGVNNVTISGIASHGGGITKDGTATLTLSGANTYSGATTVESGVVAVSNATGLGTTGSNTTVNDGAALQVSGSGVSMAEPVAISGTGISNAGSLRKTGTGTTTLSGGVTLNAPSRINADAGTLTISNLGVLGAGQPLTVGGAGATTISGPLTLGSALLTKDGAGTLTLSGTNNSVFSGKIAVNGGVLAWSSDNSFTNHLGASPAITDPAVAGYIFDYVTVDGGTLRDTTSDTTGTSFMRQGRGIALGANGGTIDMSSATVGAKALYGGAITLATGVTSATLTKTGAGEFRYNGPGTNFSGFTKLVLKGGLFRSGSVTGQNWETAWGAVPASVTADAITLDGGQFSSSFSLTLNANRGITITSNGGTFVAGGGTITVPGPLTGSGKLIIGLSGGTVSTNSLTLSNAGNTTTFTGAVEANSAVLTLSQSLNATNLSGTATGTGAADVSVASSRTFTVGSDNTSTNYPGRIVGSGTFTKIGTGVLTLNTVGTNEWTNTGGINIGTTTTAGGTIQFGTTASGFATTVPVTIQNGGTLDMNNINDTFGSLVSATGHTTGQVLQGTGNLTLGQTATTARTYNGTITSTGGTFTKGGGAWTQTLNGNNTLGDVNVTLGRLDLNGTNTTGAVNVGGGTLGGTGSVSGTVNLNSGVIAPGTSIESLDMSALTLNGGSLEFELGAPGSPGVTSDLINVISANGLTINAGSVTLIDAIGLAAGTYPLINYTGSVQGLGVAGLGTPTGPAGFTYALQDTGTNISVVVTPAGSGSGLGSGTVPEPASLVLLVIASLGLLHRRVR